MKKRNRFLKIVSSILGVFVICGFFACSFFSYSKSSINVNAGATPQISEDVDDTNVDEEAEILTETVGEVRSSNVSDLTNSNFSMDYVNYKLEKLALIYTINPNVVQSGTGMLVKLAQNYTFEPNVAYEFLVMIEDYSSISELWLLNRFFNNNIVRLDSYNPGRIQTFNQDGGYFSILFRVLNSTAVSSGDDIIAFYKSNHSITGRSGFVSRSGLITQNARYVNENSLKFLDSLVHLNSSGGASTLGSNVLVSFDHYSYDISYENIVLYYNGLKYVRFRIMYDLYKWNYTYDINQTNAYFLSYPCRVLLMILYEPNGVSTQINVFPTGEFQFVGGEDATDSSLLEFVNRLFTFVGFNTYSMNDLTPQDYLLMIDDLNSQIRDLQNEVNSLSTSLNYYIDYSHSAYEDGFNAGIVSVENQLQQYYQSGYADGYGDGSNEDATVVSIFSGILQVALVPINFFLAIFNFEILNVNLSAFIRAIFTVALTIIVIKTVTGKGGDGSDN